MATRAIQLDFLLSGLTDPDTGAPLSGGVVSFYEAGTTTPKNVWSEKVKANAYTSITLDSNGSIANPYYGDGWYKIIIEDSDGNTEYTWDQVYLQSNAYSIVQKTEAYTATADDDVILCNGTFTVTLGSVAGFQHPLVIKNIGSGVITVDPEGSETIDGASTLTISVANDIVTLVPDTTSNVWRKTTFPNDLNGAELILDADGDTSIRADTDDTIDFKINGTDTFQMSSAGFKTDTILEKTSASGVTIDGVLLKDNAVQTDTILEKTSASGVTIDSVLLKDGAVVLGGISQGKDITVALNRKIVEIGDWNMNSTASVTVAHGVTSSKIRAISVMVRNDSTSSPVNLYPFPGNEGADLSGYVSSIGTTDITLARRTGGYFDAVTFEETSYNRGWVVIDYVD
jgi:hypothetical protein